MSDQEHPISISSLTNEEQTALRRIQFDELNCDWCNEPLFSRLIFDENEPDLLISIEVFCKSCNRVYSVNPKSLRYWDEVLEQILQRKK